MKEVAADEPIVVVEVVVEPVPVQVPAVVIPVEVRDDQVAVRVLPCCTRHHLSHCPSKAKRVRLPISELYFMWD